MNSRIKENSHVYTCIDNYFLVCKTRKDNDVYKYDLYRTKNVISIVNYFGEEITNNFLELINSFSSGTELILYIYEKKELDDP